MKDEWTGVAIRDSSKDTGAERTRPRTTVSYAQTLDGRIATADGSSQWISAPDSLRFAHELRAAHDAVLIGAGTACSDDPSLTVRLCEGDDPLRIITDSFLRTPLSCTVFSDGNTANTLVATTDSSSPERRRIIESLGAKVEVVPSDASGRVDLAALLDTLPDHGVESVMVEGGAQLITALLNARLVDSLAVCIAPRILGSGIEAIGELGIRNLDDSLILTGVSMKKYGPDFIISGDVEYRDDTSVT